MESVSDKNVVSSRKQQRWALEPALFLLFFGWFLSVSIVTNQILKQTCLYTFKFSESICDGLDDKNLTLSVEQEIQPYVANILMTTSILNSIVPTVLSLFLGTWSDKYGRKKVLNCVFVGYTTTMGWFAIVSYISHHVAVLSPWNYLFAQLPFMMFGGLPTTIIIILCYITDQTTETNRSTRITIVEIIMFTSVLIAVASSSFVLEWTDAPTLFTISFSSIFIGTLIVIFFVEETVHVKQDVKLIDQCKDLFTTEVLKQLFVTCTQPRPFKQRRILWLITVILVITNFTNHGSQTVFYLFTRQKFGWNLQDMTLYESGTMLMTVFGSIIGLVVMKKILGLSDLTMSMVSLVSLLVDGLIKTVANYSWQLYVASAIALFKLISGPMLRSILSMIVSKHEISKIYSITQSIEGIAGLGAAPLYTKTYAATFTTFPSAFNLITSGSFAIAVVLAILISRWLIPITRTTVDTKL